MSDPILTSVSPGGCVVNKPNIITIFSDNLNHQRQCFIKFHFLKQNNDIILHSLVVNVDSVVVKCPNSKECDICEISISLDKENYSNKIRFVYSTLPVITSISPRILRISDNSEVELLLKDENITNSYTIRFIDERKNIIDAKPNKIEDNKITCILPNELKEGIVFIEISNDGVNFTAENKEFTLNLYSIDKIEPSIFSIDSETDMILYTHNLTVTKDVYIKILVDKNTQSSLSYRKLNGKCKDNMIQFKSPILRFNNEEINEEGFNSFPLYLSIDNLCYTKKPIMLNAYRRPKLLSIEPVCILRGHPAELTIKGQYFANTGLILVKFFRLSETTSADYPGVFKSPTEITVSIPSLSSVIYAVCLSIDNGKNWTDEGQILLIYPEPNLKMILPSGGDISGDYDILIRGSAMLDSGNGFNIRFTNQSMVKDVICNVDPQLNIQRIIKDAKKNFKNVIPRLNTAAFETYYSTIESELNKAVRIAPKFPIICTVPQWPRSENVNIMYSIDKEKWFKFKFEFKYGNTSDLPRANIRCSPKEGGSLLKLYNVAKGMTVSDSIILQFNGIRSKQTVTQSARLNNEGVVECILPSFPCNDDCIISMASGTPNFYELPILHEFYTTPKIISIKPSCSPERGGTNIVISGTNLAICSSHLYIQVGSVKSSIISLPRAANTDNYGKYSEVSFVTTKSNKATTKEEEKMRISFNKELWIPTYTFAVYSNETVTGVDHREGFYSPEIFIYGNNFSETNNITVRFIICPNDEPFFIPDIIETNDGDNYEKNNIFKDNNDGNNNKSDDDNNTAGRRVVTIRKPRGVALALPHTNIYDNLTNALELIHDPVDPDSENDSTESLIKFDNKDDDNRNEEENADNINIDSSTVFTFDNPNNIDISKLPIEDEDNNENNNEIDKSNNNENNDIMKKNIHSIAQSFPPLSSPTAAKFPSPLRHQIQENKNDSENENDDENKDNSNKSQTENELRQNMNKLKIDIEEDEEEDNDDIFRSDFNPYISPFHKTPRSRNHSNLSTPRCRRNSSKSNRKSFVIPCLPMTSISRNNSESVQITPRQLQPNLSPIHSPKLYHPGSMFQLPKIENLDEIDNKIIENDNEQQQNNSNNSNNCSNIPHYLGDDEVNYKDSSMVELNTFSYQPSVDFTNTNYKWNDFIEYTEQFLPNYYSTSLEGLEESSYVSTDIVFLNDGVVIEDPSTPQTIQTPLPRYTINDESNNNNGSNNNNKSSLEKAKEMCNDPQLLKVIDSIVNPRCSHKDPTDPKINTNPYFTPNNEENNVYYQVLGRCIDEKRIVCRIPREINTGTVCKIYLALNGQQYLYCGKTTVVRPPCVNQIVPNRSSKNGGFTLRIYGDRFIETGDCSVAFIMPRYSSSRAIVEAHLVGPNCMECKVPNIMDVIRNTPSEYYNFAPNGLFHVNVAVSLHNKKAFVGKMPFFYHLQPIVMTRIDPDICYSGGGEKIVIYGENFLKGEIYYVRLLSCREEDHIEKFAKASFINNGIMPSLPDIPILQLSISINLEEWCAPCYIKLWKKWNRRPKRQSANRNLSPTVGLKPGELKKDMSLKDIIGSAAADLYRTNNKNLMQDAGIYFGTKQKRFQTVPSSTGDIGPGYYDIVEKKHNPFSIPSAIFVSPILDEGRPNSLITSGPTGIQEGEPNINYVLPSIKSYKLSLMPRPDKFFGVPKDAENTPDPTTYAPPLITPYEGSYTDSLNPFGSGQTRDEFYEYQDKCRKTPGYSPCEPSSPTVPSSVMISTAKRDPFPPKEGPGPCVYSPDMTKESDNQPISSVTKRTQSKSPVQNEEEKNSNLLHNEDRKLIPHLPPSRKNSRSRKSNHRNVI